MRVLIVDDHVLFREGLMSLLKSQKNFEVVGQAGTMREAVDLALQLKPELILMDFSLPDGTGLEATEAILAEHPDCKIVFLTVYETDEKLFAALRRGAKGYLLKNVPVSALVASLQSLEKGEVALSRTMTSRLIEEFAHTKPQEDDRPGPLAQLSRRELDVLRELATGASNHEIAQRLYLSENTVKHYIHSLLEKLGVENRHQAAQIARQHGLSRPSSDNNQRIDP